MCTDLKRQYFPNIAVIFIFSLDLHLLAETQPVGTHLSFSYFRFASYGDDSVVIIALSRRLKPKQQIFNKLQARTELQAGINGEAPGGVAAESSAL